MNKHIAEIATILQEETRLFNTVCSLEENKTGAIMTHDGRLLDRISREQEGLLGTISALESSRMRHADLVAHRGGGGGHATLADIVSRAGDGHEVRLRDMGRSLRSVLIKLKNLQETNQVLINDNMEYYNILLTGLRRSRSADAGYGEDGREEEKLKNSILFNKKA
jgi:hypothetical protein